MNFREVLKRRLRILNREAMDRERSIDVFNEAILYLRKFLKPVGMDLLDEQYHWNWRTTLCAGCIGTYFTFLLYTIYVNWGQWILVLESCTMTGMACQGIVKMHNGLKYMGFFNDVHDRLKAMHERNSKHKENNRVLVFNGLLIQFILRFFSLVFMFAGLSFFMLSLYQYVRYNELVMAVRIQVPGIDPTNEFGFVVTTIYHVLLVSTGIAGILAADMAMMMIVLHILGIADVYKNALKELDQLLEAEERDEQMIHRKLLEICVMHQELISYEEGLDSTYGTIVFVQVISSVACLVLSLFITYMTRNIGIAFFLVAAVFQLFEFCLLGTTLTVKNDHIELAIYDTCWYKLCTEEQKMMSLVLFRSQNAVEMTIGGVALLNMETFVEIMKTIYSSFAMMVQVLE
ncbi:putative odorant receptor 83c [Toxorhynchites rutilus septentrionalis]|uniref:putative odorant receptor 83c n=1 Tax=Toxorhynchites rutilus septentrionalis TaxID=329112 RepID=UPI002478DD91|nr:putative odorant receptor 83c [Toxorhynchites rutilus septentrionalis]